MTAPSGFIDPPGAFAPAVEWRAFLKGLRALPSSPDVDAAIADAERKLEVAPDAEDDDFSDLA